MKDLEKSRKLTSRDGGYFEHYNRENVDIRDLKETPITEMVEKGIRTSDEREHELDVMTILSKP